MQPKGTVEQRSGRREGSGGREDESGEGAAEEEQIPGSKSLLSFVYFAASLYLSRPHFKCKAKQYVPAGGSTETSLQVTHGSAVSPSEASEAGCRTPETCAFDPVWEAALCLRWSAAWASWAVLLQSQSRELGSLMSAQDSFCRD